MAQLNFYVPEKVEEIIRKEARSRRQSISSYLSHLVRDRVPQDQWQRDFFKKVIGGWQGNLPKIERLLPEERDLL